MMSQVDWLVAKRAALLSALSLGALGWFFAMLRGSWSAGLLSVSTLTGLFAAALAVRKAQANKVYAAIAAASLGILLALAEGIVILVVGLVLLSAALESLS